VADENKEIAMPTKINLIRLKAIFKNFAKIDLLICHLQ